VQHGLAQGERTGVAQRLYRALTDIQTGRAPDPYGWTRVVEVPVRESAAV